MPAHNILVTVIDGLRASALGAYGNTTSPTPALDRFASESFLFDWCFAPSEDLSVIYRALWRPSDTSFPSQLRAAGYRATLITDDPVLTSFPSANDFDQCVQLGNALSEQSSDASRASDSSETSVARLFATAAERMVSAESSSPQFVWVHSRGMYGPWDAPLELQWQQLDEGDPPPVEEVTPPNLALSPGDDPDAAFRFASAYAAQAMVLDECWETLQSAVTNSASGQKWFVTLLGARGFPLGEHRQVGGVDPRLYAEQLHVPWLIRDPHGAGRLGRSAALVTHADLAQALLSSLPNGGRFPAVYAVDQNRASLHANSRAGYRALRTAEWCLRQDRRSINNAGGSILTADSASGSTELFVRPDDRWEANDVAKLCQEVVETLTNQLDGLLPSQSGG